MSKYAPGSGLLGNYAGSCIVCLRGTDTAVAFEGTLDWHAAGLVALGMPKNDAIATVQQFGPALDDHGRGVSTYRVCGSCTSSSSAFRSVVPGLAATGSEVPCISEPRA